MNTLLTLMLCVAMSVGGATEVPADVNTTDWMLGDNAAIQPVEIPNPFIDCQTLTEASAIAGFSFSAPESINDYTHTDISAIKKDLIQVRYTKPNTVSDGLSEADLASGFELPDDILIRKAVGSDDVSGDYNIYSNNSIINIEGMAVSIKGDAGLVNVATWTRGNYAFAIASSQPMSIESLTALIKTVK